MCIYFSRLCNWSWVRAIKTCGAPKYLSINIDSQSRAVHRTTISMQRAVHPRCTSVTPPTSRYPNAALTQCPPEKHHITWELILATQTLHYKFVLWPHSLFVNGARERRSQAKRLQPTASTLDGRHPTASPTTRSNLVISAIVAAAADSWTRFKNISGTSLWWFTWILSSFCCHFTVPRQLERSKTLFHCVISFSLLPPFVIFRLIASVIWLWRFIARQSPKICFQLPFYFRLKKDLKIWKQLQHIF